MTGACRDVTRLKAAEEALREETRTLEILNATGTLLAGQLELEHVLQAVTDAATDVSGAGFGAFFYNATNDDGDRCQLYTVSGAPREALRAFRPAARVRPVRADLPRRSADPDRRRARRSALRGDGAEPRPAARSTRRCAATSRSRYGPGQARSSAGCSSGIPTRASSPSGPSGSCSVSPARPASPSTTPASTSRRSAPPRSARRCSTASAPPAPRPSA